MDDSSFQALAAQCPGLQHLCIGFEGSDESIFHPDDYYCSVISDAALTEIAHNCHQLKYAHSIILQCLKDNICSSAFYHQWHTLA